MGTKSRVGQYGTIPEDLWLRKIEETDMYEDADQVESFQRQTLKDNKAVPYFFESDAPRINSESGAIINLHYGGYRSNEEPDLPDGTFLDFDHFNKDPRSICPDPNFSQFRDQGESRAKYFNFYPDNDDSVMEVGINPMQMRENIIHSIPQIKNRLKIFATSRDSRSTKAWMPPFKGHCRDIVTVDNQILDLNAATCAPRNDFTTSFTNASNLGWWTDTDATFNVAKYGQIRPEKPFAENWHHIRKFVTPDQVLDVSKDGIHLTRDIALMMIDHVRNRANMIETGRNTLFGEGIVATNSAAKTTADRIDSLIQGSATKLEHTAMADAAHLQQIAGIRPKLDIANIGSRASLTPQVVDLMQQATVNRKTRMPDDLYHHISDTVASAVATHQHADAPRRAPGPVGFDPFVARSGEITVNGESMAVRDYSQVAPMSAQRMAGARHTDPMQEAIWQASAAQKTKRSTEHYKAQTAEGYRGDIESNPLEGLTKERFLHSTKKGLMRAHLQHERDAGDMNDV